MSVEIELSQNNFLMQGGVYARAVMQKIKSGEFPREYVYHEYPKLIRKFRGTQRVEKSTEIGNGSTKKFWEEEVELWDEIIVHSEEEEERVLSGGKTAAELEEERQGLVQRCRQRHIAIDPAWSAARLRRELGDGGADLPTTGSRVNALAAELDALRQMKAMQDEIAALRAQLAGEVPDEAASLRQQLTSAGVKVDGRWSLGRLQAELERVTAPEGAV
jgi:hypothetical protein